MLTVHITVPTRRNLTRCCSLNPSLEKTFVASITRCCRYQSSFDAYTIPVFTCSILVLPRPSLYMSSGRYFNGKSRAEEAITKSFPSTGVLVKPTFIYGGDSFGLTPPRVSDGYGSGIDALLSSGPIRAIAGISPGLVKVRCTTTCHWFNVQHLSFFLAVFIAVVISRSGACQSEATQTAHMWLTCSHLFYCTNRRYTRWRIPRLPEEGVYHIDNSLDGKQTLEVSEVMRRFADAVDIFTKPDASFVVSSLLAYVLSVVCLAGINFPPVAAGRAIAAGIEGQRGASVCSGGPRKAARNDLRRRGRDQRSSVAGLIN